MQLSPLLPTSLLKALWVSRPGTANSTGAEAAVWVAPQHPVARSKPAACLLHEKSSKTHPADAEAWGITDGDFVTMASRRGEIQIKARLTDRSPRGTVFTSFSFASVPVNELTGSGYDPVTDTAELKVCPVRIGKV